MMDWQPLPDDYVHPGDNLSHGELRDRQTAVGEQLHAAGMTDPEWQHMMPMETGHYAHFSLHPQTGRWNMEVHHIGDPAGSVIQSDLGTSDAHVPERGMSELRHRDVVRAMGEQMNRAYANGTPYGPPPGEHAYRSYPANVSHVFAHYPEQESQ